jgi:predicted transcriptional regulator
MLMTDSTTIRVDRDTHRRLLDLSQSADLSLMEVLRRATAALEQQIFVAEAKSQMQRLRSDPQAWADYLRDSSLTEVSDGVN